MHNLSDRYRPEIDGLRALAVVSVIISHFGEGYLPGGFLGVDIFFVISGYVITGSLLSGAHSNFSGYISDFYARRILRLLPTLLVVILIGSVAICLVATWQYASMSIRTAIAAVFGVSNIYLYSQAIDYWGGQATLNPFTHTWSLGVEEQFYLLYPLLIWLIFWSPKVNKTRISSLYMAVLWSLALISLISYITQFKDAAALMFYGSPFRFWEILSGGLLFIYSNKFKEYNIFRVDAGHRSSMDSLRRKKHYLAVFGLLMILLPLCLNDKYISVPIKTLLVVGATVLFIATAQSNRTIFYLFTTRPIIYIGKISYSLYLWHWPVLVYGRWMGFEGNFSILVEVLITFTLSIFSYRYIECYFRHRKSTVKNSKIIIFSILISCFICLLAILSGVVARKLNKQKMPFEATMIHDNYPCHDPKWTDDPIKDCLAPKNLMLKHIYVMGDSHSTNLIPSIENSMGEEYELRYLGDAELQASIFKDGPPLPLNNCLNKECDKNVFQSRMNFLNNYFQPGDKLIYTISRDNIYEQDFDVGRIRNPVETKMQVLEDKVTLMGKLVASKGGQLYLVEGIPKVCSHKKFEIGKSISPKNPCIGSKEKSLNDRQPLSNTYKEIAKKSGAVVLDPHPYLCPLESCASELNGRLLYFDGSPHFITAYPDPLKKFFTDNLLNRNIGNKNE